MIPPGTVKRYYRLGPLDSECRPVPAGNDGFDSHFDWHKESGQKYIPDVSAPTSRLAIIDDTVGPAGSAFQPMYGFHTPPCQEVTIFLSEIRALPPAIVGPPTIGFNLQLRVGLPFAAEPQVAVKVAPTQFTEQGMILVAKGLSFVAVELWGYIPAALANPPTIEVQFRILVSNTGSCCEPDFRPGLFSTKI